MASHDAVKTVTLTAGANLTIGQVVAVSAARTVIPTGAVTSVVVGIAAETVASGGRVPVALLQGIVEATAGVGGVTVGEICVPNAVGLLTSVANTGALIADQMGCGIALGTAVAGETFEMLAMPIAAPHSA